MISGISIENFKGVRDRIDLDLRPITLLFGANSAGKSTITDSLNYFEAVLNAGSATFRDLTKTEDGQITIELSFERLVHNHDLHRAMKLRVECELTDDDGDISVNSMEDTSSSTEWGAPTSFEIYLTEELRSLSIEIEIVCALDVHNGGRLPTGFLQEFTICYNQEKLVQVTDRREKNGRLHRYGWAANLSHPLFSEVDQSGEIQFSNYHRRLIAKDEDPPLGGGFYRAVDEGEEIPNDTAATYLNAFVLKAFQTMKFRLSQRRAIGGIRDIPHRNTIPMPSDSPKRWSTGLAAWDYLAHCGADDLIHVNAWLGSQHLATGYQLKQRQLVDFQECANIMRTLHNGGSSEGMQRLFELQTKSEKRVGFILGDDPLAEHVPFLHPSEVGTGLSQIVPVIVASVHPLPCFNSIAQPDLHLHPRLQAELGDLFIESINRNQRNRFLLETHSEHLILRILRRIRETHVGKVREGLNLATDDLAIYFISQDDGVTQIELIEADVRGEFIQPWPDDFFELDFYERFE